MALASRDPEQYLSTQLRCPACNTVSTVAELIDGWAISCPECGERSRDAHEWEELEPEEGS